MAHATDNTPRYGLIFDVDGVIADTEAVNALVTAEMLAEEFDLRGVRREDFADGIGRGAEAYVQAAARVHGRELTPDELDHASRVRQEKFLAHLATHRLPAFPGVLPLVEAALSARDMRPAIATSSTRAKSQAVLRAAGVPFKRMVYINGDDVSRKKPAPDLFLLAAERLALPPARCLVIEDAPNGVEAAQAAGCVCLAVTNSVSRAQLSAAESVVDTLAGVGANQVRALIDAHRAAV